MSGPIRLALKDCISQPVDDIADLHVESFRNDLQGSERHALAPGFEAIKMYAVQSRPLCQLILGQALLFSEHGDALSDHDLNVLLQPIRLWAYAALKHPA